MKENTGKQSKDVRNNPTNGELNEGIKWFEQFDNNPSIYDVLSTGELNMLKQQMLTNIKIEINKQD